MSPFNIQGWRRAIEAPIWQAMHHVKGCIQLNAEGFVLLADSAVNGAIHDILGS